jgi:hypothetical protein
MNNDRKIVEMVPRIEYVIENADGAALKSAPPSAANLPSHRADASTRWSVACVERSNQIRAPYTHQDR